jgi:hypothetical protein
MRAGMHVVADISCALCLNVVGWKYVRFCGLAAPRRQ